ncbi:MAG: hypothetical protein GW763_10725 [Paraglaciecola sp.]|nr:hypothetical protein [Paraglaciecola sp.]NCT48443.1 hypothetical protein [Paraglaciecola sp.]
MTKTHYLNMFACVSTGIFTGGTLMIAITFGLQWRDLAPNDLLLAFSHDWKNIAATIIPFALLQTMLLPIAVYLAWPYRVARKYWLIALLFWLLNCTITSVYHLPVVLAGLNGEIAVADITTVVEQWLLFHWPRVCLGVATTCFAILAAMQQTKKAE